MDLSKIEIDNEIEETYWVLYNDVAECFLTILLSDSIVDPDKISHFYTSKLISEAKHLTFRNALKILKTHGQEVLKDYQIIKVVYSRKEKFTPSLSSPEVPRPSCDDYMKDV